MQEQPKNRVCIADKNIPVLLSAKEKTDVAKLFGFAGVLLVLAIVGLLFFLRPTVSEAQQEELARFPEFSVEALLNGDYTSEFARWYADTFPGRDAFISMREALEKLYGVQY